MRQIAMYLILICSVLNNPLCICPTYQKSQHHYSQHQEWSRTLTLKSNIKHFLTKLQPIMGSKDLVTDNYGQKEIARDVSASSSALSIQDVEKILNAESS